jgi:hypothetical protein
MPEYQSPDDLPKVTYRRSQIRKMSPAEYAKNSKDISAAVAEGRIEDDETFADHKVKLGPKEFPKLGKS